MIRNLKPETVCMFGTLVPRKDSPIRRCNSHVVSLTPREEWEYETTGETWLSDEDGRSLLSVYRESEGYLDFYLDRPIILRPGVRFRLTAFQENSSVQIAGAALPALVQTVPAEDRFAIRPRLLIDRLYTIFYQEVEQGYLMPGSSHPMLELTYVDRGTLHSVADGVDLVLRQGNMAFYGPNQWHMQYAEVGEAPRFVTIAFDAHGLKWEELTNRSFTASRRIQNLLQELLREQEQPDEQSGDMLLNLLAQILLMMQRSDGPADTPLQSEHSAANENAIIHRAMQFVGEHVREKLPVPVVAAGIQVSASYLTSLFQKHLQISPGEYIRRIKLQESKQLIRQGDMNFTEIAQALQYSTIHQFSRQFKDKFGITPSEYAKSVRG